MSPNPIQYSYCVMQFHGHCNMFKINIPVAALNKFDVFSASALSEVNASSSETSCGYAPWSSSSSSSKAEPKTLQSNHCHTKIYEAKFPREMNSTFTTEN